MARLDRIDKKELKRDPLLEFVGRASDWVGANTSLVLGGVVVVVAAIALLSFWSRGREQKMAESDLRVTSAVQAFTVGQYQQALDMANNVRATHPGSRAATMALYVTGQVYLQQQKYAEAEAAFREYLATSDAAPFYVDAARAALAAALEAQNRFTEAAAAYLEAAENQPEIIADGLRLDAARAWRLAGNFEAAHELLDKLAEKDGPFALQAQLELAVLKGLEEATPRAVAAARPTGTAAASSPADSLATP